MASLLAAATFPLFSRSKANFFIKPPKVKSPIAKSQELKAALSALFDGIYPIPSRNPLIPLIWPV